MKALGLSVRVPAVVMIAIAVGSSAVASQRPWSAQQACGPPNTATMGDYLTAWAARLPDGGPEWLQLEYPGEVDLAEVVIYESYNPGAVTKLISINPNGTETLIWEGRAALTNASLPREFKIVSPQPIRTRAVRIYLDTQLVSGWNEIDAVALVGRDGSRHWATLASASSSYADTLIHVHYVWSTTSPLWSPQQALGPPDTPLLGDLPTAWASREPDAGAEWLLVGFSNAVEIAAINIIESCAPGAVSRVIALPETGDELVLWEGVEPARAQSGNALTFIIEPNMKVRARQIKIELDTARIANWNEIDAVELVGADGSRQWAINASASSTYAELTPPAPAPVPVASRPTPVLTHSVHGLTERVAELERRIAAAEATAGTSPSHAARRKDAAGARSWFPQQACGPPDTPQMGDIPTAWASRDCDGGREWLELGYERAVEISQLQIYETYNPGAITNVVAFVADEFFEKPTPQVYPRRRDGLREVPIWSGMAPRATSTTQPHILVITPAVKVTASKIRIELDTSLVSGWNEIDAVELVGRDNSRQWAMEASASSSFGDQGINSRSPLMQISIPPHALHPTGQDLATLVADLSTQVRQIESRLGDFAIPAQTLRPRNAAIPRRRDAVNPWNWGPEQACGAPDTMQLGDFPTAWAPSTTDAGTEWLELSFERAVDVDEVRVFESCGPGAITKLIAFSGSGPVVLKPRMTGSTNLVDMPCNTAVHVAIAAKAGVRAKKIRVELDTRRVSGWNEIDAVELIGRDGSRQWAVEAAASTSYAD